MQQNTLRLAPKRSAKCCKTRDKMQQNTQKTIKNGVLSAIYRQIDHFRQETTCWLLAINFVRSSSLKPAI